MDKTAEHIAGWTFVLLGALAAIGGVVLKLADMGEAHPGGGDLATWVAAVFAGLAFAGTIFIATTQQRQQRQDRIEKGKLFAPAIAMKLTFVRAALDQAEIRLRDPNDTYCLAQKYWGDEFERLTLWSDVELEPLICIPGDVAVNLTIIREIILVTGKVMRNAGQYPATAETREHVAAACRFAETARASMQHFFDAHSHTI